MFSYLSPEQRVRKDHPLRAVRAMTDEILERMSPLFDAMYAFENSHGRGCYRGREASPGHSGHRYHRAAPR
jgi:hypothetical protein